MFHPRQQPPSLPFFSYPTHYTPNPNPHIPFSLPIVGPAEPVLHPPGTETYANAVAHPLAHVASLAPTQYCQDPNAGSLNWLVGGVGVIGYDAVAPTGLNSLGISNWANQALENGVLTSTAKQGKLWCELCNVVCNSKDVFDKHVTGKKHVKNLKAKNKPSTTNNISLAGQTSSVAGQPILGTSGVAAGQGLEVEKQIVQGLEVEKHIVLSGGATTDSARVCTICNVTCNSQEVFNEHIAGKKHAIQAGLIPVGAVKVNNLSSWKKRVKKAKFVQSAWCEVCKINCNSTEVYTKHLLGKKHLKNLEKSEKTKSDTCSSTSNTAEAKTNDIIGPAENPEANKGKRAASTENLETKKQKVMEGGSSAGAVKVCTICNVVCNSQTVYNSHVGGQKHAAMLKKHGEIRTATLNSQPVVTT